MKILVTGGYGFIGGNFIKYLCDNNFENIEFPIINVDSITYAANPLYIKDYEVNRILSYFINISNYNALEEIISKHKIDTIVNFAAETHVDNSISKPKDFIYSNYIGVFNLLELSRKYNIRFHQISTDEVFGSAKIKESFTENSKFNPSSPYSASKAAADLLIKSYNKTYKTKFTISHCTNNYGPNQHKEKLIPKAIYSILNDIKIPVYGNGLQTRNWIYVEDHCEAIWKILNKVNNKTLVYNIAGNANLKNLHLLIKIIGKVIGKTKFNYSDFIEFIEDRPAHDIRYDINDSLIRKFWSPNTSFDLGIEKTINYYKGVF
jgi:dTDP-glucose 4,6-dehydratase